MFSSPKRLCCQRYVKDVRHSDKHRINAIVLQALTAVCVEPGSRKARANGVQQIFTPIAYGLHLYPDRPFQSRKVRELSDRTATKKTDSKRHLMHSEHHLFS